MTADAGPEPVTTGSRRLGPGEAEAGGYRPLVAADGERHLIRDDLAGMSLPAGWRRSARPLLVIAHLSDTHVMDHPPWPTRPCWLRWHASSPPTTGRCGTRSAPTAAPERASRPTGMCCWRSTGPGRAYQLPQSSRCHHRRVSSACHLNWRGGLWFQPWMHRPSLSRQSPGQSPAQCRQCLVRLTSAMCHMIGAT